ncbi:hypothetical protein L13192_00098 [Pyrenophora tritici-repentis]|nr:hypothetical protein L13192_00098 [Pyrenophora tritici-repentis]
METTQPQEAQKTAASKASPLKRHPIVQAVPSSPPMVTQTIFLDHPSARLSSSPASSPRIVEPSPTRRGSVHPVMSETMERGLLPGADFFDDGSSDSEWEDSEGDITQIFSLDERYSLRSPPHAIEDQVDSAGRGRSRERSTITSLPHLSGLSSLHDPGLGIRYNEANGEKIEGKGPKRARQMSLRRLNMDNIRVVQTGSRVGTPRESLRSAGSDAPSLAHVNQPFPHSAQFRHNEDAPTQHSPTSKRRYRRNTSESMIADSIINAHVMTMRALESLNSPVGSISLPSTQQHHTFPRSGPKSLSTSRHITLSPLSIAQHSSKNRPPRLPAHFIKTTYPFSAKKQFPKPKSRPRRRGLSDSFKRWGEYEEEYTRLDSAYGGKLDNEDGDGKGRYSDAKGKYVLGLVDGSAAADVDMRSRMQRNESAQGVVRGSTGGSGNEGEDEGVVWVGMRRDGCFNEKNIKPSRWARREDVLQRIDFDDAFFAYELRNVYHELSGSWLRRTFGAKTLSHIRLSQYPLWSGTTTALPATHHPLHGLLATTAHDHSLPHTNANEPITPFNETALLSLFHRPKSGRKRYSWSSRAHVAQDILYAGLPTARYGEQGETDRDIKEEEALVAVDELLEDTPTFLPTQIQ